MVDCTSFKILHHFQKRRK